jgi:hypothetical protein
VVGVKEYSPSFLGQRALEVKNLEPEPSKTE